jgi:hypothetical protein
MVISEVKTLLEGEGTEGEEEWTRIGRKIGERRGIKRVELRRTMKTQFMWGIWVGTPLNSNWGIPKYNSKFFEKCGDIESVRIIYDKETGKSKGFGYVQFENPNSLQTAIQLNASELDGRNIKVDNANKWFHFIQ